MGDTAGNGKEAPTSRKQGVWNWVKLEESIGYSRDRQKEKCMKQRPKQESDIGEDALVLAVKKH